MCLKAAVNSVLNLDLGRVTQLGPNGTGAQVVVTTAGEDMAFPSLRPSRKVDVTVARTAVGACGTHADQGKLRECFPGKVLQHALGFRKVNKDGSGGTWDKAREHWCRASVLQDKEIARQTEIRGADSLMK